MTDPKPYLKYLDKEMTIMGLLSAFSVAVPSLAFSASSNIDDLISSKISQVGGILVATAAYFIIAAFFFYLQRSLLAFYYGQIALAVSTENGTAEDADDMIHAADGWDTWLRYQTGFAALSCAIFSLFFIAIKLSFPPGLAAVHSSWFESGILFIAVIIMAPRWYVLTRFPQAEDPFKAWRSSIQRV